MIISFHSLNPERYEKVTNSKKPLEKVIRTIEYMRENSDIHIALKYVITAYNISETAEILAFAQNMGVDAEIHPVMVSPTNRETSTNNYSLLPGKEELLKAIEKVIQFKQKEGTMSESFNFYNYGVSLLLASYYCFVE